MSVPSSYVGVEGGKLPYNLGHIGMCGPTGYGFSDVLVINSVDFDQFVLNRIYNKILDGNWFSARLFMEYSNQPRASRFVRF